MQLRRVFALTLLLAATSGCSFWLGFREGSQVAVMLDAVPRGGLSLFQLESAKQGVVTKNMVTLLESDIDQALVWAHQIEQYPIYSMLEPVWSLPISSMPESLAKLANYRKLHPSPFTAAALSAEPMPVEVGAAALHREVVAGAKERERVISSMVSRYAQPVPGPK